LGRPMPGWEINSAPLYRLPFATVFINTLTAAVLGASAGFLEVFIENGRDRNSGIGTRMVEDPYALQLVAEASYAINGATLNFLHLCDEMMRTAEAGAPFTLEQRRNCVTAPRVQPKWPRMLSNACLSKAAAAQFFSTIRCSAVTRISKP
ncbi:MAG TPA: hypothetical protein VJ728_17685, partial [Candidatus Binataceae bacterium]|nr:hypothetical protein [Candidatus Binataceae bacterium]